MAGGAGDGAEERVHEAMDRVTRTPVARPLLPTREALAPYLDEIDANRWYSNLGPLCQRFETQLAERFALPPAGVATVANATVGLVLALEAAGAQRGTRCLLPSWTFSATGHSVVGAGLTPVFVDVDEGGTLTPEIARDALARERDVGAVVPVAVYGQPLDPAPWEAFQAETGVPVVIDAAPAFDCAVASSLLSVVSLHATKILGVGEGGFCMSTDAALVANLRQRSNFGFYGSREAQLIGTNGKISEYAAAVGLAGLQGWAERRAGFQRAADAYRGGLAGLNGVRLLEGWGERWLSSTCVVRLEAPVAGVAAALDAHAIETRAWWGEGLHRQRAFAGFDRHQLANTERLAASTLGLPMYQDLAPAEVDRVVEALRSACPA